MRQLKLNISFLLTLIGFNLSMDSYAQSKADTIIYKLDVGKSILNWRADNHFGTTKFKSGTLGIFEEELVEASFAIEMDSIKNTDIDYDLMRAVLENTIKSRELLHITKFPLSYFNLCCAEKIAVDSLFLKGDLTLRNIPACIQFQTFLRADKNMLEAKTDSIAIDRTDWGIFAMSKNHSTGDQSYIVSDTIYIQINLIANQIDEKEERFD